MEQNKSISMNYTPSNPVVMGIINVTPDSFYSSSRCKEPSLILKKIDQFVSEGGAIIDLGGCSTRPNSVVASEKEELDRVLPALELIRKEYPDLIISIDTFRGNVARRAVEDYQVSIINDVYAFERDENMLDAVVSLNVPYVLTHYSEIKSQEGDFMSEIFRFFADKISLLKERGVQNIFVDPGYGFGKTMEQNFELLSRQSELLDLGCPILAGISRKRMIWQSLSITPDDALNGTTVLNTIALQNGASILRVHDVKEAVQAVRLSSLCSKKANK